MKDFSLNIEYVDTKILRSILDFTDYKGRFTGTCQQTLTIRTPKDLSGKMPVYCDLDVKIGGEKESIFIQMSIRSAFDIITKDISELSDEDYSYCQKIGFKEAADLVAKVTELHTGKALLLSSPEELDT